MRNRVWDQPAVALELRLPGYTMPEPSDAGPEDLPMAREGGTGLWTVCNEYIRTSENDVQARALKELTLGRRQPLEIQGSVESLR